MGGSQFVADRRKDPDVVAEKLGDDTAPVAPWKPTDADWTLTDELLAKIFDRLGEVVAVEASVPLPKGAKRVKPPPQHPRPIRGIDILRVRQREQRLAELTADVEVAQQRWQAQQDATAQQRG